MSANYIVPFIESTTNVFQTMLNMPVKIGRPGIIEAIPSQFSDVSGIIGMSGDVVGTVVLSFPFSAAGSIVARFIGMDVPRDSEDFCDAVGELVNMVSGGAKAKFEGKTVSISCPTVVVGENHKVQQMSDAVCICIPCSCEYGEFAVEVSIKRDDVASLTGASTDQATQQPT
jgi:chemotaxis protein CheX